MQATKSLLNDAGVARRLGISKASVWRHVANRQLPQPLKIGGSTRWDAAEIEAVIELAKAARDAA